jgi:hypothetical protein
MRLSPAIVGLGDSGAWQNKNLLYFLELDDQLLLDARSFCSECVFGLLRYDLTSASTPRSRVAEKNRRWPPLFKEFILKLFVIDHKLQLQYHFPLAQ